MIRKCGLRWQQGAIILLPFLLAGMQAGADAAGCFNDCDSGPSGRALEVPRPPARTFQPSPVSPEGYPIPRGGSYVYGGDVANLPEGMSDVLRITAFDPAHDPIVFAGQPVRPDAIPRAWRVFDHNGSMTLWTGGDGAIVLRGVPQADWAAGVLTQKHGTSGADVMVGDATAEVFATGSGLDQLAPAGGDDRIIFTSGYLVILSDPPNSGDDTLDLRRFSHTDIVVAVEGDDALIFTPDGAIRLEDQFRTAAGVNIEQVLLATDEVWPITSAGHVAAFGSRN